MRRNRPRDNASRTDDGPFADRDAAADDDVSGNPAILLDDDWLGIFPIRQDAILTDIAVSLGRKERMHGRIEGDIRADEDVIADRDRSTVENREIEVGEKVLSDSRVDAVVKENRSQKIGGGIPIGNQHGKDAPPLLGHMLIRRAVLPGQDVCPFPLDDQDLVAGIIDPAGLHLFLFRHFIRSSILRCHYRRKAFRKDICSRRIP